MIEGSPLEGYARASALLISALFIVATVWPALRDPPRDSFPLSTYPMFSSLRERPWIDVIVGFDAAGNQHRIGPGLVANAEVMQAAQTIRKAIRRKQARSLCEQVAARVANSSDHVEVIRLEVQSRQFDPRSYFVSDRQPLKLRRRASCEVLR